MQRLRQPNRPPACRSAWEYRGAGRQTMFRQTLTAIEQSAGQGRDFR